MTPFLAAFLQYMDGLSRQFKAPFISWMGTDCFLYINDPNTVEQIFNSTHCTNKGDLYRFISSAIGDGLFTSSSPRWHKHRRLINPAFGRQILSNFLPIFNIEAEVLLQKLDLEGVQHGKKLEIYQILKKIVLEAACREWDSFYWIFDILIALHLQRQPWAKKWISSTMVLLPFLRLIMGK